jgi:ligand-binding sensor domain-containing protein
VGPNFSTHFVHRRRRGCFFKGSKGFEQLEQSFQPLRSEHLWHHRDRLIGRSRPQSVHLGFLAQEEQVPLLSFAALVSLVHAQQRT